MAEIFPSRKQLRRDLEIFNTPAGRNVLANMAKRFHVFSEHAQPGDAHMTHYFEGQRSVVIWIMSQLRTTLVQLDQLAEQAQDE